MYYFAHTKSPHYEILLYYYLNKTIIQFLNTFGNDVIETLEKCKHH